MKILAIGDFQGRFSKKLEEGIKKEEFDLIVGVGDYGGIDDWYPWVMADLKSSKEGRGRISPKDFFGKRKLKEIIKRDILATKNVFGKLNYFGKPVIMVFGNGDDLWYSYPFAGKKDRVDKNIRRFFKKLRNIKEITYGNAYFKGVDFLGFGGYMDIEVYLDKKVFLEAAQRDNYSARLKRLRESRKNFFGRMKKSHNEKIFVFHYPPLGVFDIIKSKKNNPMKGKSAGVRFFREAILKYKPKLVLCGHMHEYQGVKRIGRTFVVNPGDAEKNKYAIIDYPEMKFIFVS